MEAVGELAPNQAPRLGRFSDAPFEPVSPNRTLRAAPSSDLIGGRLGPDGMFEGGGAGDLGRCLELLKRAC
jgi:hypothetical protein